MRPLICQPVHNSNPAYVTEGSIKSLCPHCDQEMWISRSGQQMIASGDAEPCCMECLPKLLPSEIDEQDVKVEIPSEVIAEVQKHFGQQAPWRGN